jgi:hypothetical protein
MITLFTAFTASIHIAIDFGSSSVKFAITDGSSPPAVALVIPAFIAFRAQPLFNASASAMLHEDEVELLHPEIGDKALAVMYTRPWLGTGYFGRFACVKPSVLNAGAEALWVPTSAGRLSRNDLSALFLQLCIDSVAKGDPVEHIGVVFPSHFTSIQRAVFVAALDAVNYTDHSEIDEVDAVALNYIFEWGGKVQTRARRVLFVDIGGTSVKAYVLRFARDDSMVPRATRLSYAADLAQGGAFLAIQLARFLGEKANMTNTTNVENRRLLAAAEKLKVGMSELNEMDVIVELPSGIDIPIHVTRSELESVARRLVEATVEIAREAIKGVGFDEIEVIGGTSQIPIVRQAVAVALNASEIGTTLHPVTAVAIGGGCALQFALKTRSQNSVLLIDRAQLFDINAVFLHNTFPLCTAHGGCENKLSIWGYNRDFHLAYKPNSFTDGLESLTQSFRIVRHSGANVSLHFRTRPFGFVSLEKCSDAAKCTPGAFRDASPPAFSRTILNLFRDPKSRASLAPRLRKDIISTARKLLDVIANNVSVRTFSNHSQRLDAIRCIEVEKKWVNAPENAALTDARTFGEHLRQLKRCIAPIYRRIHENATWWENAQGFFVTLVRAQHRTETWKSKFGDDELIRGFAKKLFRTEVWFNQSMDANQKVPTWQDIPVKGGIFAAKHTDLKHEYAMMKKRFGSGQLGKVERSKGIVTTDGDDELPDNLEWMQRVRNADLECLEQDEDSDPDDAL